MRDREVASPAQERNLQYQRSILLEETMVVGAPGGQQGRPGLAVQVICRGGGAVRGQYAGQAYLKG